MKPTEELKHEHEIIMHMLSGAERFAQSILSTHTVEIAEVAEVIDFSRHFTDGCHHSKEEKHLFVRLQERGMSQDQGPIAMMLYEHGVGRKFILSLETSLKEYQSGKQEAAKAIGETLLQYINLLRTHIAKENNILFPMGDRLLTDEDQQFLEKSFKIVEEQEVGAGIHEKYHRMAHEIAHR
jgi:hemerythrin-like domain-containing protein